MDPGTAIRAAALIEEGLDADAQALVSFTTGARAAPLPGVVAGPSHAVERAHAADRELIALGFDELEDLRFRSEENRMDFFKSSCSAFSIACSRSRAWRRSPAHASSTSDTLGEAAEQALARLFPPARQHEGVNVQR